MRAPWIGVLRSRRRTDAWFDSASRHDINPKEANVAKQNIKQAGGEKWFEWPLTPASVGMTSAELIGELYETISALNRDRGWNLTMVAPARFGEIVIDREAGCLRAKCAWKAKDPSQLGPEPAGYVKGA